MLARLLSLTAALLLTIACGRADANALQPKTAPRGFAAVAATASEHIALASLEAIKEKVAAAGDRTSSLLLGEQLSPSTALGYHRARWLAFDVGRFTQMDRWQGSPRDPTSLNAHLYANANPVSYTDPSGFLGFGDQGVALNGMSILSNIAMPTLSITARVGAKFLLVFGTAVIGGSSMISNPRSKRDARDQLRDIVIAKAMAQARNGNTLYHYTTAAGAAEIMATQSLSCTSTYKGHLGGGVTYPAGAYATEIEPWDPFTTQRMLGMLFFGGNQHRDLTWFAAIDGGEFNPVYGSDNQWVRQCPAGDFADVEVFYIGPSLLDP